jgi:hypothetical protein
VRQLETKGSLLTRLTSTAIREWPKVNKGEIVKTIIHFL